MINIEDIANKGELFDGHYKLLHPLNTDGATADVWLAIDTNTIDTEYDENDSSLHNKEDETGMLVAIKIYRPKNALDIEGEQRFRDEFKIVYECRHENLLQPTSFAIYEDIPYLVLPYCKYGSSEQLIGKKLTEEEIWKFILDVASGLSKLHSNQPQIIHQDIKPANILIDNSHNYAITDFGISSKTNGMHGGYYDDENSGTFAYMAPERFNDNPTPIPESDIWAFGATLCEILTGKVPFGEEGGKSQIDNTPMPLLQGLSSSIKNLIYACLQKDPQRRPTAKQIQKAALAQRFPLKNKKQVAVALGFIGLLAVVGLYFLFVKPQHTPEPYCPTTEESFQLALEHMKSDAPDLFLNGLQVMDSLSKTNYIPAMYEMAFTYGWFSDSVSMRRKQMLDIKVDSNHFPISENIKIKTLSLLSGILDLNDSAYAKINAQAAYRLASYHGDPRTNDNNKNKKDNKKALSYLMQAEAWAEVANDTVLLKSIKKSVGKLLMNELDIVSN